MRGSSGSFGIVTSIQVTTFPAPSSASVFKYIWDLSAADAANATQKFQKFVQTNISQEFGAELVIGRGSASGRVSFGLTGGWYAPTEQLADAIAPFLADLSTPSSISIQNGTYINSVQILGAPAALNTSTAPDTQDTFYAKSLMTPEASPMTEKALNAFMFYLGKKGFTTFMVRFSMPWWSITHQYCLYSLIGMVRENRTLRRYKLCH